MKIISLEYALTLSGDSEAIKRGYLNPGILKDAKQLAEQVVLMPTFGKLGYLAAIGNPHQWWAENCKLYAEFEADAKYARPRRFSLLLKLADTICFDEKVEAVASRVDALRVMNQSKSEEYIALANWLSRNQFTF